MTAPARATSRIVAMPGVVRPMLWLALPVLAEQTLFMLVGFVDTFLAGHFVPGAAPMAAIGLIGYIMWVLSNLFAFVSIGTTALVARWVGAGRTRRANQVVHQALIVGSVSSVVATVLVLWGTETLVGAMHLEDEAAWLAGRYLRVLAIAIPGMMIEQVGIAALRAAGDTVSGFVAMALVNTANVVVSGVLVSGALGAPRLGWDGLVVGTVSGHGLGAVLLALLLIRGRAGLRLRWRWLRPRRDIITRLLSVGIPGGVDVASVLICHLVFLSAINSLGTLPAAAHSLAIRIESIAYLPGAAFQVAATTMAGQYLGAGDARRAARGVWMCCLWAVALMASMGIVFFSAGELLAMFFTGAGPSEMITLTGRVLRIAAGAMPALALTIVLSGALRGAGDTRWPFVFTLVGMVGIRIPLGIWFAWDAVLVPGSGWGWPGCDMGLVGAWYAMILDIFVRAGLVLWRFFHGGWKYLRIT